MSCRYFWLFIFVCCFLLFPHQAQALTISTVTTSATSVKKYDMIEFTFTLDQSFTNPYDPEQVDVMASITTPNGVKNVPGFYYVPYRINVSGSNLSFSANGSPSWKIRFTPAAEGHYTGTITVNTRDYGTATASLPNSGFDATASDPNNPGFIRVSSSGKFLKFDNGQFFFPLGQNLYPSWAQGVSYNGSSTTEYDMTMQEVAKNGGNSVRVMGGCNNASLRWDKNVDCYGDVHAGFDGVKNINQLSAAKIDDMFEVAKNNSMYINYVILGAGATNQVLTDPKEWGGSPYNSANGGPASNTLNFFTNPEAKRLYKQELRYFISRWGYSPNLIATELLQEMDWMLYDMEKTSSSYRDQVITAVKSWSAEMLAYIRSLDPNNHLITTSGAQGESYIGYNAPHNIVVNGMFDAGPYNLAEQHVYISDNTSNTSNRNVVGLKLLAETIENRVNRPWIFGEYGLDQNNSTDTGGIGNHNAVWVLMMRGTTPWKWQALPRYDNTNLVAYAGAKAFLAGEDFERDFGSLSYSGLRANVTSSSSQVFTLGLKGPNRALLWAQNTSSIENSSVPSALSGVNLTLNNLTNGNYTVEFWKTLNNVGKLSQTTLAATNGSLTISLPTFTGDTARDIAVKVISTANPPASTVPSPSFSPSPGSSPTGGLNPVTWWKLDENSWNGSSGEVKDSSGNNLNGTAIVGTGVVAGHFGNAANFDGIDDGISLGNPTILQTPNNGTISGWVNLKSWTAVESALIVKGNSNDWADSNWRITTYGSSAAPTIQFCIDDGVGWSTGTNYTCIVSPVINYNQWYHVALTWQKGTGNTALYAYLNGNPVNATVQIMTNNMGTSQNIYLGKWGTQTGYNTASLVDDVRIFNTTLSASQITALYQETPGSSSPPTTPQCKADANSDKIVNMGDIAMVNNRYGQSCTGCKEDTNGDDVVNIGDINFILGYWGLECN